MFECTECGCEMEEDQGLCDDCDFERDVADGVYDDEEGDE